ncbi:MAG: MerR family transcriptional regulator, partial [Pseudomonadota bacterium]
MADSDEAVLAAEAARRLGVSVKALRHYEARGLLAPRRTGAGWRAYGAAEMARAGEIVALRALGLSLAEVARVLDGDPAALGPALEAHAAALEGRARALAETAAQVRALREALAQGQAPGRAAERAHLCRRLRQRPGAALQRGRMRLQRRAQRGRVAI